MKLLIGRLFHVGYTLQGVWKLLRRHGCRCRCAAPWSATRRPSRCGRPRCGRG
ncbi:winged helix-turn-helix domain-containing protein [Streptomyces sp. B8F3]|uniref:winged helix-turn-helix domain-containing protein n=1 Tax=unclassified Streptomyces TaxID=2593676 RepID=UPI00325D5797